MYNVKWYYSSTLIAILFALWPIYGIPLVIGIALLVLQISKQKKAQKAWEHSGFKNLEEAKVNYEKAQIELKEVNDNIKSTSTLLEEKQNELKEINAIIDENKKMVERLNDYDNTITSFQAKIDTLTRELTSLEESKKEEILAMEKVALLKDESIKLEKQVIKQKNQISKYKTEVIGIQNFISKFPEAVNYSPIEDHLRTLNIELEESFLSTIVELDLHYNDSKLLRKEMSANNKEIKNLLKNYQTRYTTKANLTIYDLMVIGLQAELQNILHTLSYTNLDKAITNSKALIEKYLTICANGNAQILPTITRFLTELEPLFSNAIQIEYKYYIQKEREKEEQRQIREQMRQEAEERKLLEAERKKLEQEEEKFLMEIQKNKELLEKENDPSKLQALEERIRELQSQHEKLEQEKEEIVKRANGKAGYVYVISNLGSFGINKFKIGMTRRLNPLDRIDELGSASVPFKFDIHAMIFSDNAVDLEQKIHQTLEKNRVNKINLRKEFFSIDVQQLQDVVQEIDSTVEFTTTMKAEEYRQSQSLANDEEYQIA